jgi:hydroxyacylglutathione hydrolase
MVIERAPLEDELGDVLDKAIRGCGRSIADVATEAKISLERLLGVIDYCERLSETEVRRLAEVLKLNPRGLWAVASEAYPLPEIRGLPFCLYPLRMPHGIGVANAYLVADCGAEWGLLFDTGTGAEGLWRSWPAKIQRVAAVFLTHYETEHCGGLAAVRARFPEAAVFGPAASGRPKGVMAIDDGAIIRESGFLVRVRSTPGHADGHYCYEVSVPDAPDGVSLLVSGDLLFAGSIGGAYYCSDRLNRSLHAVIDPASNDLVVAPGHGPLTTIKNERTFNPFVF